jgi:ABC-type transport system involved in cytochrome c biogenesis ATPase subunit
VAGLARPSDGTVRWAPGAERSRIVALAPAATPFETVSEVMTHACAHSPVKVTYLSDAMHVLELTPLGPRPQVALTTDERARLALAIGLATGHPLLLLDGTADALAAASRPLVLECLRGHAASGGAVLLTGRDVDAVQALASTVFALRGGRLGRVSGGDAGRPRARVAERAPGSAAQRVVR